MADRKPGSYPHQLAQVCNFGELTTDQLHQVMQDTEVSAVWGIGRKTSERLNGGGIRTVLDLIRADSVSLRKQFSVVVERTVRELRGTSCVDIDDAPPANQQIMCSRSFGEPVTSLPNLVEAVSQFATRVAEKLRHQGSVASAVHVFISTSPYRKHDRQHSPTATLPLVRPTQDTRTLVGAAVRALQSIYRPDFNYLKAGVMLIDLQPEGREHSAMDLFADQDDDESTSDRDRSQLMAALDALNQRFGRGAVNVASAARRSQRSAHGPKQEQRTPRYTTRLDEILTARA
jgi:DNA polymerase V